MIRRDATRIPISIFRTPTIARPKPINATDENLTRLGTLLAACPGRKQDIKDAAAEAKEQRSRENVAALLAGREPEDNTAELDAETKAKLEAVDRNEETLIPAVDEAGNQHAAKLVAHAQGWIDELGTLEAKAATRLNDALKVLRDAADELGQIRASVIWLTPWTEPGAVDRARAGRMSQYHGGGRIDIPVARGQLKPVDIPLDDVLDQIARVTQPTPESARTERGHRVAKEQEVAHV